MEVQQSKEVPVIDDYWYLVGVTIGDGTLYNSYIRISVGSKNKEFADCIEQVLIRRHTDYSKYMFYQRYRDWLCYDFRIRDNPLMRTVKSVKDNLMFISLLPKNAAVGFLQGLTDAEGSHYIHHKKYYETEEISITNTNLELLQRAQWLLASLSIDTRIDAYFNRKGNRKSIFKIRISKKISVRDFLFTVGFRKKSNRRIGGGKRYA